MSTLKICVIKIYKQISGIKFDAEKKFSFVKIVTISCEKTEILKHKNEIIPIIS